jgi:hypothetical protein
MPLTWVALAVAGLGVLGLNVGMSVYVGRLKTLTRTQKLLQLGIVWLVPLVGALLVYIFHRTDSEPRGPDKPAVGPFEGMEG